MERKRSELLEIASLTDIQVMAIENVLSSLGQAVRSPAQLIAAMADCAGEDLVALLVGNLLQLHQLSRRIGEPVDTLIARRRTLTEQAEDGDPNVALCGLAILERIAKSPVIALTARSIDLAYDCDNILQRSRVLTDVRPIFSDDANDIDGAIVAHTLRLRYDSAGQDHELSLAMDVSDLRQLILQCERALLKDQTAKKQLIEKANIMTTAHENQSDEN